MSQNSTRNQSKVVSIAKDPTEMTSAHIDAIPKENVKIDMSYLTKALTKYNASDLHIKVGRPPLFRINGKLIPAKMAPFTVESVEILIYGMLNKRQIVELKEKKNIDLTFQGKGASRFRCNVYYQKGTLSAAVRPIPATIPTLEMLGIPAVMKELCMRDRGLLLVTGATGSGKSTTLAALIQYLNEHSQVHALVIEDPIEYVYRDQKASITQREVGTDTLSFEDGIRAGLRQDPDVIVIGEMRDQETIQAVLTAAETGHLVISTLHTNDAKGALERILDVFPADSQNQIRIELASTLVGVISQQLILRADGQGRVPACEVLIKSPVIETYIMENELERIPEAIAESNTYYKMQTMNQALEKLVNEGVISVEEAIKASPSPDELKLKLEGVDRMEGYQIATG